MTPLILLREPLRRKEEYRRSLERLFRTNKVDYINISTARPYIDDLQPSPSGNNGYAD